MKTFNLYMIDDSTLRLACLKRLLEKTNYHLAGKARVVEGFRERRNVDWRFGSNLDIDSPEFHGKTRDDDATDHEMQKIAAGDVLVGAATDPDAIILLDFELKDFTRRLESAAAKLTQDKVDRYDKSIRDKFEYDKLKNEVGFQLAANLLLICLHEDRPVMVTSSARQYRVFENGRNRVLSLPFLYVPGLNEFSYIPGESEEEINKCIDQSAQRLALFISRRLDLRAFFLHPPQPETGRCPLWFDIGSGAHNLVKGGLGEEHLAAITKRLGWESFEWGGGDETRLSVAKQLFAVDTEDMRPREDEGLELQAVKSVFEASGFELCLRSNLSDFTSISLPTRPGLPFLIAITKYIEMLNEERKVGEQAALMPIIERIGEDGIFIGVDLGASASLKVWLNAWERLVDDGRKWTCRHNALLQRLSRLLCER